MPEEVAVGAGSDEVIIEVESDLYDASDPGWMREVEAFSERLAREASAVRRPAAPVQGAKGAATTDLIVGIVGSGGGQIAATAILGWVRGYRDRRVKVRRPGGGEAETLTVQDKGADAAAVRDLADQLERLAQQQGPPPG